MKTRGFWRLDEVSDTGIVGGLKELIARSAWTEARLVAYLAELDARKLHLLAGKSLFAYCQQQLGLSGNEAHYRIQAARMARNFPVIFELLDKRQIHLSALALIRHYITPENHQELLREVSGKTKEQILRLLATRAPRPEVANRIRTLPVPAGAVAAGPSGALEPRSAASYCLQLNIGEALKQKLELACDLMSHNNPSRDWAIVVERGLDALLEKLQKRRFAQTSRPGRGHATATRDEATIRLGATTRRDAASVHGEAAPVAEQDQTKRDQTKQDQTKQDQTKRDQTKQDQTRRYQDRQDQDRQDQDRQDQDRQDQDRPEQDRQEQDRPEQDRQDQSKQDQATPDHGPTCERGRGPEASMIERTSLGGGSGARTRKRIAAEVLRGLVERDGLGCAFIGTGGERCSARGFLQVHHRQPWARGGAETLDNLQLVCADHNRLLAERDFGIERVQAAIERKRVA